MAASSEAEKDGKLMRRFFLTTEEGDQQQPSRRPEGRRQGPDRQHQEGRVPRQLPRQLLQLAQGRQAPRDEVVDFAFLPLRRVGEEENVGFVWFEGV